MRGCRLSKVSMLPSISIIIPCYNEARTIGGLLEAIIGQTFPLDDMEVVIADGMSDDGMREAIQRFAAQHPEISIRVVDNPKRVIPAALNRAIEASTGRTVVRLDAHSVPRPDYVQRCLEGLERTGAANVGGNAKFIPSVLSQRFVYKTGRRSPGSRRRFWSR